MAKEKKQKPKDEGPMGAPDWVVTFTDMISLLVTFFVLLMTFSSMEEYDLLKVEAWLTGQTGVMVNRGEVMVDMPEEDFQANTDLQRGAIHPHDRPSNELEENLAEMGQRQRPGDLEVSLMDVADGLVIEFGDEAIFESGSPRIPPALLKSLGEMARVLEAYPHMVVVEGYPGPDFAATSRFATPEDLSFARASRCAEALFDASTLSRERVQIVGLGETHIEDDPRANPRPRNRGIQLRILTLSKLRASFEEGR